jgi:hypothetical protein
VFLFIEKKKRPVFVVPEWNKVLPDILLIYFPTLHQSKTTNKRVIKKNINKKQQYKRAAINITIFCTQ